MTPQGKALFLLRLLQWKREPVLYLLGGLSLFLALFSTVLAPLPPLEGGRVWADFLLSSLQACLFLFSLHLLLQPEGLLLDRLPILPGSRRKAEFFWGLAEWTAMLGFLLPGLALGWALLPGRLAGSFLAPLAVLLVQGFFLVSLGGTARRVLGRGGGAVFLLGAWVLLSLPPLSWADPRRFSPGSLSSHGGSLAGALLVWGGLCWACAVFRCAGAGVTFSGIRGGS